MAREIKFRRAYFRFLDGAFERFVEWGPHDNGEFTSPAYVHGCKAGPDMQFTGLRLDGVDIFEGDLIRLEGKYIYDVKFRKGSFVLYHAKTHSTHFGVWGPLHRIFDPDFSEYKFEVIGNIHQHKHLLE